MMMMYLHFFHGCWKIVFNIMKPSNIKIEPRSEDDPYLDLIISEDTTIASIDFVFNTNVAEV